MNSRLATLAAVSFALAAAALAAPATVWNLQLERGKSARTSVTVTNRCQAAHTFEVVVDPKARWFSVPGAATASLAPGAHAAVEALVDARALAAGEYVAPINVRCLDCGAEPLCSQNRDAFDARLKVLWSAEDLRSLDESTVVPGEILAFLETGADDKSLRQVLKALDVKVERSYELKTIGRTAAHLKMAAPEKGLAAVLGAVQNDPAVRFAQPNFLYALEASDPYSDRQYALQSLGASRAHRATTGRGISVAVLDSFVNTRLPNLKGAIPDSVDFFRKARPGPTEAHGTMMAGLIGARENNGEGIAGIAPDATLIAVRVCGATAPHSKEICTSDALSMGLDFAIADQARVISMSLAGPYDPIVSRLVERAVDGGIVVVGATGNDGRETVLYPAALEKVIAVTAIDKSEHLYEKANRGARVDVAAPGVNVVTLTPLGSVAPCTGTSPAAAEVSGVVALLLQVKPKLTPEEVRRLLEETARDLGPPGRDDQFGWGAVDACRALAKLTGDTEFCR